MSAIGHIDVPTMALNAISLISRPSGHLQPAAPLFPPRHPRLYTILPRRLPKWRPGLPESANRATKLTTASARQLLPDKETAEQ